jgi:hypothetical protein
MLAFLFGAAAVVVLTGDHPRPTATRHRVPADSTARQIAADVYNGRAGDLAVRVPRINAQVVVDGTLTAPPWQQAAVLTGFSEYLPVDGVAAEDSTEVLVWYSPTAIYFGVRAFESHGAVHAALANRDAIDSDDNVQLILRPFVHSRQALVFAVNPFGVQEDGTITEGLAMSRGAACTTCPFGVSQQTGPPPTDLTPDFVYESKGHLTPFGFEVVIRIPFRSLKYQSVDPQDWGINVIRHVQHSGHTDSWYPAKFAAASYLGQAGTLTGLTKLERGLVLDLNPFATQRALGAPDASSGPAWQYGVQRPQLGTNVRWGVTNNLTLNATYRPDFAEIESDATQLALDPRNAVSYPEKRPFFLDGLEQFSTPNNLIYTRRIQSPIGASKLTGKIGDVSVAWLGAVDDEGSVAAGGGGHPSFDVLRLQKDVGERSLVGVALTDKESGGSHSRLASADARLTFAKIYSLQLQAAGSSARNGTSTTAGPLWQAHFIRGGRTFVLDYNFSGIDPEFQAASGFISRTGVASGTFDHRLTFYPKATIFETVGLDVSEGNTWVYRQLTSGQAPEDRRHHFTAISTLRGGWKLYAGIYFESYGYDPTLYKNYFLGHVSGRDTTYTHFTGSAAIPNTDYILQINTPQFSKFNLSLLQLGGRDENFYEWSAADISITEATLDYRPTNRLRAQLMYNAQIYWRHSDGTIAAKQLIPRLKIEYQLSRPVFFRLIGQYDASSQSDLRDDSRTNLPLFTLNSSTGVYTHLGASQSNQFQLSGLFSYQPVPGTVAFIGYGNNLEEPEEFRFALRRVADSFFVKVSYLFRME